MIYVWYITLGYQNSCKIITNDYHNGNTCIILSMDETYVDHRPHPKFNEVNNDVTSHATMVICNLTYIATKILVAIVICNKNMVIGQL